MKVTFKQVKVKEIVPYAGNPRINDGAVEVVRNSIADFGFRKPIIVDEGMVILAGHTRLKALEKLGAEDVAVAVVEGLSEDQKAAYRIMDNRAGELSGFDFGMVASEIESFAGSGIDMGRYGFEPPKVDPPPSASDGGDSEDAASGRDGVVCPRCGKVVE